MHNFTVYTISAERVSSLGKDWHRPCLRCEKCKKTLSAGGHAEVLSLAIIKSSLYTFYSCNLDRVIILKRDFHPR